MSKHVSISRLLLGSVVLAAFLGGGAPGYAADGDSFDHPTRIRGIPPTYPGSAELSVLRICCLEAWADQWCSCLDCTPMVVDECPAPRVSIAECCDGGDGAEPPDWGDLQGTLYFMPAAEEQRDSGADATVAQSESTRFVPVDPEIAPWWPAYIAELQGLVGRFPAEIALNPDLATALLDELCTDIGHVELNDRWQLHVLYRIELAGAHPEISDEALDVLREGLADYQSAGWAEGNPMLEARLAHTSGALDPPDQTPHWVGGVSPWPPSGYGLCVADRWECYCDEYGCSCWCIPGFCLPPSK